MAAFAFEVEYAIDHVLDDARACDLPVLGDMADQNDRRVVALREADEILRGGAHLAHGAGCGFEHVGPHGLDRVDDDGGRRLATFERRHDVLEIRFRAELHRALCKAQTARAHADLSDRLFAGDIDNVCAPGSERRHGLQKKRRLADAGVAADQQHRARNETAAAHAVEFGNAGDEARRVGRFARHRDEFDVSPLLAAAFCGPARDAGAFGDFLDDRVPLAAGFAPPRPARSNRAAGLADEVARGAGHQGFNTSILMGPVARPWMN